MVGRVAPDGRAPQPPGVGKTARRHDLEQPKTPSLDDRSMQYGDVKRLEKASKQFPIVPPRSTGQGRSAPLPRQVRNQTGQPMSELFKKMDPLENIVGRAAGTLGQDPNPQSAGPKTSQYLEFLRRVASLPNASAPLVQAFIRAAKHHSERGTPVPAHIDTNSIDDFLADMHGIENE